MTCNSDNRPGCKGYGHTATGSWARDVYKRVRAEQEQARQRALLEDQIKAGGVRAELWQQVKTGERCACYKQTNQQSDRKCVSCHGSSYVPGWQKFGHNTLFMSSVDTDITLTNTKLTTDIKSSKIELVSGATSGTVESTDKSFSRTAIGSSWDYDVQTFERIQSQSSVTVEYSLDSGSTWSDMSNLVMENPISGTIRFRATLTRDSANILSPYFAIVRARYATIDISDDGRFGPWVLLMRPPAVKSVVKSDHGDFPKQNSLAVWTAGLSMFDSSIEIGSTDELIEGPGIMFQLLDGANTEDRYIALNWQHSDPLAYVITTQNFTLRVEDPIGPYSLIW